MAYDIENIVRAARDPNGDQQSHRRHGWTIARWTYGDTFWDRLRDAYRVFIGRYHAVDWDGPPPVKRKQVDKPSVSEAG